eukprot:SAG31_NODE_13563_length_861_cov_0.982940_1_plen_137_part_10
MLAGLSAELHALARLAESAEHGVDISASTSDSEPRFQPEMSGWLQKQGQKNVGGFKRRYFVLRPHENEIAYYNEMVAGGNLQRQDAEVERLGTIDLNGARLHVADSDGSGSRWPFEIRLGSKDERQPSAGSPKLRGR